MFLLLLRLDSMFQTRGAARYLVNDVDGTYDSEVVGCGACADGVKITVW